MAYARRSSYRRKGRRGARTLTTRRIFNNKSARAQAAQISALKKRINRVYNRTKPEYKLLRSTTSFKSFGYDTSDPNDGLTNFTVQALQQPNSGTQDNQRIGNKVKMYPVTFFMNIRYNETNQIIDNVYPYIQQPLNTNGLMMRFVAIQAMAAANEGPTIDSVFQNNYVNPDTPQSDLMMMMTMPFRNGITARYKILKDKRIHVNKDKPLYAARFKIKPQIKTLRWEDGQVQPAGQIYYIILVAGGDYNRVTNENGTFNNFNSLEATWRYEIPYTDA